MSVYPASRPQGKGRGVHGIHTPGTHGCVSCLALATATFGVAPQEKAEGLQLPFVKICKVGRQDPELTAILTAPLILRQQKRSAERWQARVRRMQSGVE